MGWSLVFRIAYRGLRLVDLIVRLAWRMDPPWLRRIVELEVRGRRTGRRRRTLVTLLDADGRWYIGHPNGRAAWVVNLEADPDAVLRWHPRRPARRPVVADRLPPGPEREAVVRATWSQQPFPADVLYWLARHHVRAAGVYFRLTPVEAGGRADA